MVFDEAKFARGTGAQGGQFVSKGAGGKTVKSKAIGYDGTRGSGYGAAGGDTNVKALQKELNRLGILDAGGKQLKVDGKFGPKTTAAVRRLQAKLKLPVDGKVTPALLAKIKKLKPSRHEQHVMHDRHLKATGKKTAPAKKVAAPAKKAVAPAKKTTPPAAPKKRAPTRTSR